MITEVITNTVWKTNTVDVIHEIRGVDYPVIMNGLVAITMVICFFWFLRKIF